jgi:hypothetical protein
MKTRTLVPRPSLALLSAGISAAGFLSIAPFAQGHPDQPETGGAKYEGKKAAASHGQYHKSWPAIEALRDKADKNEAMDEPLAGETLRGTPVTPRTPECFPAEPRDVFWQMDMVASGPNGELQPLNFDTDGDGKISDVERNGIRGRNTWLLWGGGNEAFWGWLQEDGYGIEDFLILLDSRKRGTRFNDAGMVNQPGFRSVTDPAERILGLYLDLPKSQEEVQLKPRESNAAGDETQDAQGRPLETPVKRPQPPMGHFTELFEPGDRPLFEEIRSKMPQDGLDPAIYGYPSGVFGLRLLLNPDFFGNTDDAAKAREYWNSRVVKPSHENYYTNVTVHSDRNLVRPFRVSMSCGFCHVGPHPLNPPLDANNPKWENLSSFIGNQYWKPQPTFGNLLNRGNFLHYFLGSQLPGTIDTSLVSTDHINNANTINAVFDVPARLTRAGTNQPETQSDSNLLIPSIEDGPGVNPRHFPRVLLDGADSCGAFGAFIRVPLNIGTFSEQWMRCHNPVIGFKHQRPFSVQTSQTNSVFWQTNERYRVPYMASFFTLKHDAAKSAAAGTPAQNSTAAMKLRDARDADGSPSKAAAEAFAKHDAKQRIEGRKIWLNNCAICHSSKQPAGFELSFDRNAPGGEWDLASAPKEGEAPHYTLPMDFKDWGRFRASPAYRDYTKRLFDLVAASEGGKTGPGSLLETQDPKDKDHPFWTDNFLSSEVRIPVTLVGTNSSRAMATNAMKGQVWDNFSSNDYKNLPSVGPIRYFNPFSGTPADEFGTNDTYTDGRDKGGPGYYRPASHISLWTQAPFLHNNSLGLFNGDPSVKGRLEAFDDAIHKMLWNKDRSKHATLANGSVFSVDGDLRVQNSPSAAGDPGLIYRIPVDTHISFQSSYIRPLLEGIAGKFATCLLALWLWVILFVIFVAGIIWGKPRHAGAFLVLLAVIVAVVLAITGLGGVGGTMVGALIMGMSNLLELTSFAFWLISFVFAAAGIILLLGRMPWLAKVARVLFIVLALGTIVGGWFANGFINGRLGPVQVGPIPRGTPVSLMMNLDPEKTDKLPDALVGMFRATLRIKKQHLEGEAAYRAFAEEAGPALLAASKCPDFVMDRGHWFGEKLTDEEKEQLIAFLRTL